MPLLAMVAAVTERLRVGTFVLNICLRHPAVLAQDLATTPSPAMTARPSRRSARTRRSSWAAAAGAC
jgi:hypothetical protein